MIYICILLYAFLAQFTYTSQNFTDARSEDRFSKLPREAPDFEVVSVDHSIDDKNINQLSIKVKLNGKDRKFFLQSKKGFFSGKDTKVWIAEKEGNKLKYTLEKGIIEKVNSSFYEDEETNSIVSHTVNENGISEFNGIIDTDKVIIPISNFIRQPRDVRSEKFYEHENDSNKNYHRIYKRAVPGVHRNIRSTVQRLIQRKKNSNLKHPSTVYPEILVYVDKTFLGHFGDDYVKTVAYILTLWNGADLSFRDLNKPYVRLNIAGIVLCRDQIIPIKQFLTYGTLQNFSKFMYNEEEFIFKEDYDIAVLMGADSDFQEGETGLAFDAGGCKKNVINNLIESTAIILDNTKFSGIHTAAHELGHLFGAPHDGNKSVSTLAGAPGAEDCSFEDGYLMSHDSFDKKQFYFSTCTKKIMSYFFSQERAECFRNNPANNRNDKQILRILPGKHMTLDQQCQNRGYAKAYEVNPSICSNITCLVDIKKFPREKTTVFVAALEGTPCGTDKFCIRGECVKLTFDEKRENANARILFPRNQLLTGFNKTAEEQCKEEGVEHITNPTIHICTLFCEHLNHRGKTVYKSFKALDGTICESNNKYCFNGECVRDSKGLVFKKPISGELKNSQPAWNKLMAHLNDTSDIHTSLTDSSTISTLLATSSKHTMSPTVEVTTHESIKNIGGTRVGTNVTNLNDPATTTASSEEVTVSLVETTFHDTKVSLNDTTDIDKSLTDSTTTSTLIAKSGNGTMAPSVEVTTHESINSIDSTTARNNDTILNDLTTTTASSEEVTGPSVETTPHDKIANLNDTIDVNKSLSDSTMSFTLLTESSDGTMAPTVEVTTHESMIKTDGTTVGNNVTNLNDLTTSTASSEEVTAPSVETTTHDTIANLEDAVDVDKSLSDSTTSSTLLTESSNDIIAPSVEVTTHESINNIDSTTARNNVTILNDLTTSTGYAEEITAPSVVETSSHDSISNFNSTLLSDTETTPHNIVNPVTSTPNGTIRLKINFDPMPGKFKSENVQCVEAGHKSFFVHVKKQCVITCSNDSATTNDEDYELTFDETAMKFLKDIPYKEITAQDGYKCTNGYCSGGQCVSNEESSSTLDHSTSSPNYNPKDILVPNDVPVLSSEVHFKFDYKGSINFKTLGGLENSVWKNMKESFSKVMSTMFNGVSQMQEIIKKGKNKLFSACN